MCTYAIAFNAHADFPFILLGNRDEFFNRPTAPAHFWQENPSVYAGKDLIHQGSWLGINKNSRFACLSNYRSLKHPVNLRQKVLSRGLLVRDFLFSTDNIETDWHQKLLFLGQQCHGFSLLIGQLLPPASLYYFTNVTNAWQKLNPGIYAMSNNLLTDAPWPKACYAQQSLEKLLQQKSLTEGKITASAWEILANQNKYPLSMLPTDTDIPIEIERELSSVLVHISQKNFNYGTRSSTILIIDKNYQVYFHEKTFVNSTENFHIKTASFHLEPI